MAHLVGTGSETQLRQERLNRLRSEGVNLHALFRNSSKQDAGIRNLFKAVVKAECLLAKHYF